MTPNNALHLTGGDGKVGARPQVNAVLYGHEMKLFRRTPAAAPSSLPFFRQLFRERVGTIPALTGKVEYEERPEDDGPHIWVRIPKCEESGFEICIQVFDNWEVNVFAADTTVDFFLSSKPSQAASNAVQIERTINFVVALLGPGYRVRQWYRGDQVYRGRVEAQTSTGWRVEARYARLLQWQKLFAPRSEKVFQNHVLPKETEPGAA